MSDKGSKGTLGEMMGGSPETVTLKDLPNLLGEKMPKMEFDRVGKMRLMSSLRNRFGDGFRDLPGIENIIKQFDSEIRLKTLIKMNRGK